MRILWEDDAENRLTTVVYDMRPLLDRGFEVETIARAIVSNTWRSKWHPDDPRKVIEAVPGGLVVTQDHQTHGDIEDVLSRLLMLGRQDNGRGAVGGHDESGRVNRRQPRARGRSRPVAGSRQSRAEASSTVIYELTPLIEKGIDPERLADVIQAHIEAGVLGVQRPILSIFDKSALPRSEEFPRYFCSDNDPAKFIRQRGFSMEVLPTTARFAGEPWKRVHVSDGLIKAVGSTLVVHQPRRVHDDIERFLERLNAAGRELRQEAKEDESESGC